MPLNIEQIIEEYLVLSDSQVRKNAVVALAAAGTPTSIMRLVDIAVADADPAIRSHAEEEIFALDDIQSAEASKVLWNYTLQKNRRSSALFILSRMKAQGIDIQRPKFGFGTRLSQARVLRNALYKQPGYSSIGRVTLFTFLGLILTAIVYSIQILLTVGFSSSNSSMWILVIAFFGFFIYPVIAMKSIPVRYQIDPFAGYATELTDILILSPIAWWIFGASAISRSIIDDVDTSSTAVYYSFTLLSFALFCVIVRLGTIVSYGTVSGKVPNRVIQTLAGSGSGMMSLYIGFEFVDKFSHYAQLYASNCATVMLSVGFGLSFVFASFDSYGNTHDRLTRKKFLLVVAYILAIVPIVSFLAVGLSKLTNPTSDSTDMYQSFSVFYERASFTEKVADKKFLNGIGRQ